MIIIIEPQCRGFAHEQFNAAFLYGYSLAYPNDKIFFFAEKEHIKCVKSVLTTANLLLIKIEYKEINIPESKSLSKMYVMFSYYKLINELFDFVLKNNSSKMVFLSIYSFNLIPLKYLLKYRYRQNVKIHIAMHGTLEFIKRKNSFDFFEKIKRDIMRMFYIKINNKKHIRKNIYLYEKIFKKALLLFSNENITYFVFREDSLKKIEKYLPDNVKYFKSIDLPYINKAINNKKEISENKTIFATVGQGNLSAVQELVSKLNIKKDLNYEVHIIGGNDQTKSNFQQIKIIGVSGKISRKEIDQEMINVKYLLFFYDEDTYELTTSGAFFDAIAYSKPMIFLKNQCFDYYYNKYKYGYRCNDLNEFNLVIQKILSCENNKDLDKINSDIKQMKKDISIDNNYNKLLF